MDGKFAKLSPFQVDPDKIPDLLQLDAEDFEPAAENEKAAAACLAGHTKRCVVKSKTAQKGMIELNCEIRLTGDNTDFINRLADMPGVQSAVLVSYNGDYMG